MLDFSPPDCLGRRLGPRFLVRGGDYSVVIICFSVYRPMINRWVYLILDHLIVCVQRLVRDLYNILDQVNSEDIPIGLKFPESFMEFLSEMKNNQYNAKSFAIQLKATVCNLLYSFMFFIGAFFFLGLL